MFALALSLGVITAVANVLGSVLAVIKHEPSHRFTAGTLGFGGGFVLATALLEMIPESIERGPSMPAFVAAGYLMIFLLEQLLNVHLHGIPEKSHISNVPVATGVASLVAFNTHDFLDGLAIGSGMVAETGLGIMIFLAVLFHEVPAGFVIASIMRGAGWSRGGAILAGGSLGVITLFGIAIPFWLGEINSYLTDAMLALATGTFIYLGATLLVPLSEAGKSRGITFLVALGFAAFFLTSWLVRFNLLTIF